ncbi:CLUMA_CG007608, isoform A [Clunio marinus]|uniref:CLUMA_CG007608, isoform A n=1 Tax=Clunio marinus TaxID=568069 RepID=A0A1J1I1C8_9DIPT|nr:CLUMA_CG007608, isoform A [Clunio marinus]
MRISNECLLNVIDKCMEISYKHIAGEPGTKSNWTITKRMNDAMASNNKKGSKRLMKSEKS